VGGGGQMHADPGEKLKASIPPERAIGIAKSFGRKTRHFFPSSHKKENPRREESVQDNHRIRKRPTLGGGDTLGKRRCCKRKIKRD